VRWKDEYLNELQKRRKWQDPTRNLAVDDMVVVKKDNMPLTDWRLGRIELLYTGAEDRVRVVDIRTVRGTI